MSARTVNQGGTTPPDYGSLNAAVADSTAADTIEIQGTWSADDTTGVTWDVAVIVTADSSAKQIGRPFQSGDTHYRLRPTSGHVFTVTADVDLTNIDVQSESSGVSDELFRAAANYNATFTNCMLGFTGNVDQQDVWYCEATGTKTLNFIQCFFYDVGRSIVDQWNGGEGGTFTINFNSCGSYNIGANGAREDGSWGGFATTASGDTIDVNAHNCLMHHSDVNVFAASSSNPTINVDGHYCLISTASGSLALFTDTEVDTGSGYSYVWGTTTAGGLEVLLTNLTSGTYNPALVDDTTNNDAQTFHTTVTSAGLTIPTLDIIGQERDKAAPSFDVGPYALTLAAGGAGTWPKGPLSRLFLTPFGGPI